MRHERPFGDTAPAISSRQMAALSSSHSCFCRPKRKKTRKSESRFAGFVSGPICPVDFIFMPQRKEQIKNFLSESRKKFPIKALRGKNGMFFNVLVGRFVMV
jgi:hypothetical protein